jgi:hypothetical protein
MQRIIEEIEAEIHRLHAARALLARETDASKVGEPGREERGHQGEDGGGAEGLGGRRKISEEAASLTLTAYGCPNLSCQVLVESWDIRPPKTGQPSRRRRTTRLSTRAGRASEFCDKRDAADE